MKQSNFIRAAAFCAATVFAISAHAETKWQGYTYTPKTGVPEYDFLVHIADKAKEATKGELVIEVVPAGALPIKGNDVANAIADNIIQFAAATSGTVSLVPIYGVSRFPMLFPDENILRSGLKNTLQPIIDAELYKKDVVDLCMWWYPAHSIWTVDKKVEKLSDLEGMKIRVTSPQQGAFIQQFGAIPVTIATAEVAPALQQGLVEGAITSGAGARLWIENIKYNYHLLLNYGTSFVVVNREAFEDLSDDHQKALRSIAQEQCNWVTETLGSQEAGLMEKFQKDGLVVTQPDAAARKLGFEKAQIVWDAEAAKVGAAGQDALAKLKPAAMGN